MNESDTIVVEVDKDGSKWRIMPDGSREQVFGNTNWERLANMTDEEIEANALSDPDNPPMTVEELLRSLHTPNPREIRERMGLTREEFASRFHLSLRAVREWEEGELWRDVAGMMLLRVIDKHPDAVLDAIEQYRLFKSREELEAFYCELDEQEATPPPATPRYRAAG